MSRRQTPISPAFPRQSDAKAYWDQLCEITAHRILREGFVIEYLRAMTSVQIGGELGTGVVLIVSAGTQSVRHVGHTEPGISEGLRDMAQDGCELSLASLVPASFPHLDSRKFGKAREGGPAAVRWLSQRFDVPPSALADFLQKRKRGRGKGRGNP
ncbi:hypothetical protein F5B18DRAFT_311512 [Nemania serpens]|nr:hypothetical protein F5B18DRAFT_311512 [Nemania serpens]